MVSCISPTLGRARKLSEMVLLFLTGLFLALRRTAGCCYCCKMAALTDEEALGVAITLHTYFDSDDEKDIGERPRKRRASFPYVLQRKQFGFHL